MIRMISCQSCGGEKAFAVKCEIKNGESFKCALCFNCIMRYREKGMDCTILDDENIPEADSDIIMKLLTFDGENKSFRESQAEKKQQEELMKQQELQRKKEEEDERRKVFESRVCNLQAKGYEGYYEYTALSLVDSDGGAISAVSVAEILNNYALDGWRLVSAYTNEVGHNSKSAGIAGFSTQTNSTVDQHILILERYVKI